jgi:hypothetical protein
MSSRMSRGVRRDPNSAKTFKPSGGGRPADTKSDTKSTSSVASRPETRNGSSKPNQTTNRGRGHRRTRLRALSRLTGWRFESSPAHSKSPAFAGLFGFVESYRRGRDVATRLLPRVATGSPAPGETRVAIGIPGRFPTKAPGLVRHLVPASARDRSCGCPASDRVPVCRPSAVRRFSYGSRMVHVPTCAARACP